MRTSTVTYLAGLLAATLVDALPYPLSHPLSPFRHGSSALAKKASSNPKYVFAHFMVGNAYPYTVDNWVSDIKSAHANGIDAFALNIGSDDWQPQRVADAYVPI